MAIRVVSAGTTLVKRITVGTPTRIGDPSVGTIVGQEDVNNSINLADGSYLRWDSSQQLFVHKNFDSDVRVLAGSNLNLVSSDSNTFGYNSVTATLTFEDSNLARLDTLRTFDRGLNIEDGYKVLFNNPYDTEGLGADIFANDSNFFIRNNSAGYMNLAIKQDRSIKLTEQDNDRVLATFTDRGAVDLYHNNVLRLSTNSEGVELPLNNILKLSNINIINDSDVVISRINYELLNSLDGITGQLEKRRMTVFSTPDDDSSGFLFRTKSFGIENDDFDTVLRTYDSGHVELYYQGAHRLETSSYGVKIWGNIEANNIIPALDSTYSLGSADYKWKDLYLSGGTVYLGSLQLKDIDGVFSVVDSLGVTQATDLSANTTTDLAEGTNLYYTTARADSAFDVRLATKTTTNLAEGTNLYYTTVRFDSDFGDNSTTDLAEGTNLYYTTARADSDFDVRLATKTTSNLTEGSNLYYTTARADSDAKNAVSGGTGITYTASTGVIDITETGVDSGTYGSASLVPVLTVNVRGQIDSIGTVSVAGVSSVTYDSASYVYTINTADGQSFPQMIHTRFAQAETHFGSASLVPVIKVDNFGHIDSIGTVSVASVSSTNFDSATGVFTINTADGGVYNTPVFTRELTRAALVAGSGIIYDSGTGVITVDDSTADVNFNTLSLRSNLIIDGQLRGPADFYIDPAGIGDNTGRVIIFGDLQVDGTTTTVNSTTVSINDKNIVLADSAADSAAANGAGITVFGANALITYNATTDTWDLNKPLGNTRNHLVNFSTTNLSEGTNLYYTTARADSDAKNSISVTDVGGDGSLAYDNNTGTITYVGPSAAEVRAHFTGGAGISISSGDVKIDSAELAAYFSTTNITEGTNLYYTDARANSAIDVRVTKSFIDALNVDADTLDGISSESFLRSDVADIKTSGNLTLNDNIALKVGTDADLSISHDGNDAYISNGTGVLYTQGDTVSITNAAGTSTYGYFANNVGARLYHNSNVERFRTSDSGGTVTGNLTVTGSFTQITTDGLTEGSTNLYYTTARANTDFDTRLATKSTDNLTEGSTNLYYTTARADSDAKNAISVTDAGGDGSVTYSATTGVITYTGPSASEVRAHFSAGTGINLASGEISGQDADSNNKGVASFSNADFTVSSGNVTLATTGVNSGTYGSASLVPVLTINSKGQIDSAGTVSVAGVSSVSFDSASYVYTINTADGGSYPQMLHTRIPGSSGTFGSASLVPIVTVNEFGLVDSISTTSVAGVSTFTFDSANATLNIGTADGGSFNARIGLQNFSTTDLSEGTNLYYTTVRADSDARHAVSASGDLSYDANTGVFSFDVESVYTKANFDSDFNDALDQAAIGGVGLVYNDSTNTLNIDSAELAAYFSTDNITEGSNLYYTDARANSAIDVRVTKSFVDALNVDADTLDGVSSESFLRSDGADNKTAGSLIFNDNVALKIGTGEDLSVLHDTVDTYITNSTGVLYVQGDTISITNNAGTGTMGYFRSDSAARLYFNNSEKIRTKSDGVIVTGDAQVSGSITNTTGVTNTTPTQAQATSDSVVIVDTTAHDSDFTSIEYTVHMDDSSVGHTQITKLLLTYNKSNVFYTEYGVISSFTNDSDIGTLSADVSGANIRLKFQRSTGMGTVNVKPTKTIIK